MGALVFIAGWFVPAQDRQATILTQRSLVTARFLAAFLLGFMGLHLLVSGLATASGAFFAPTYDPVTAVMAGCCALSGALVLVKMALERSVFLRRITFVHRRSE
jgi:hypothetical protein